MSRAEFQANSHAVLTTLRAQAWERAKGELRSLLPTYYVDDRFQRIDSLIEEFIHTVEDEGLAE